MLTDMGCEGVLLRQLTRTLLAFERGLDSAPILAVQTAKLVLFDSCSEVFDSLRSYRIMVKAIQGSQRSGSEANRWSPEGQQHLTGALADVAQFDEPII